MKNLQITILALCLTLSLPTNLSSSTMESARKLEFCPQTLLRKSEHTRRMTLPPSKQENITPLKQQSSLELFSQPIYTSTASEHLDTSIEDSSESFPQALIRNQQITSRTADIFPIEQNDEQITAIEYIKEMDRLAKQAKPLIKLNPNISCKSTPILATLTKPRRASKSRRPSFLSPQKLIIETFQTLEECEANTTKTDTVAVFQAQGKTQVMAINQLVEAIEEAMRERYKEDLANFVLSDSMDTVIGFSAGGITAASVAYGIPSSEVNARLMPIPSFTAVSKIANVGNVSICALKGMAQSVIEAKSETSKVDYDCSMTALQTFNRFNMNALRPVIASLYGEYSVTDTSLKSCLQIPPLLGYNTVNRIINGITAYEEKCLSSNKQVLKNSAATVVGMEISQPVKVIPVQKLIQSMHEMHDTPNHIFNLCFSAKTGNDFGLSVSPIVTNIPNNPVKFTLDLCISIPEIAYDEKKLPPENAMQFIRQSINQFMQKKENIFDPLFNFLHQHVSSKTDVAPLKIYETF